MNLRVTAIQSNLLWEQPEANLISLANKIKMLVGQTDLIILPEMFTTGFSMKPTQYASSFSSGHIDWMLAQSSLTQAAICGSMMWNEDGKYYNRLIWAEPNGKVYTYNKRHLFSMGEEHLHYTAGAERLIIEYKGWRICPLICYDLRFPVWSRNQNEYDALIYIANWPEVRSYPWQQLLIARAIENQCYVAGVNRVGVDGNEVNHSGDSCLLSPLGQYIWQAPANEESIYTGEWNMEALLDFRRRFPVLLDGDKFSLG